jgi:HK97 family phage prohead protease
MQIEKLQLKAYAQKGKDGRMTVVASDETVDRSGESVSIASWDLENFRKSPRLLIDHDYSVKSVVGLADNVREENRQLLFEPVFHSITQAARETGEMVDQGFLDTVSVGYMPKEKDGRIFNELLEISFVAVPCNPNARVLSVKDVDDETAKAVEEFVTKGVVSGEDSAAEPPAPTEAPKEELSVPEPETKAGRILSERNRQAVADAIVSLDQALVALKQLLDAANAQGSEGASQEPPKQRSNDAGSDDEVVGKYLLMKQVLRAVNTATSEALAKSKLFIR